MASTNCYWKQKVEWNQQSRLNKETTQQFQWISCETLVQTLFWVRISSNDTRCYFCVLWVREDLSCDNGSSWSSSSCCGKRWSSLFVWTCEAYLQTGRLPFLYLLQRWFSLHQVWSGKAFIRRRNGAIKISLGAQVLAVKNQQKRRLGIDYFQTVNRFTLLDAYPLPRIENIVKKVGNDMYYSSLDLRSAFHQIPLQADEKAFTASEALGRPYQCKWLLFGVTSSVPAFQRVMDNFIERPQLKKVNAYLDDLTVTGATLEEHDQNLMDLHGAGMSDSLTFNEEKPKILMQTITLLSYQVSYNETKSDLERLRPLLEMPPPQTSRELKRVLWMLA